MKMIIHATIYDFSTFLEDQYILFEDVIKEIGPMQRVPEFQGDIIDVKNAFVMPGLINGHTHIYSTFARGLQVPFDPQNFVEILEQLWWKLDRNITNDITYYSGIVSAVESLKNGVTTIIDHHASGEIIGSLEQLKKAVVDEAHMRGVFCFETSDRFSIDACITENQTFATKNKTDQVRGLFGFHAGFTLSENTLSTIRDKSIETPIHIHVAESKFDQEDSLNRYNETIVERLHRYQLLRKDSILAHGIYTTNEDLQLMKKQDVVVAVNVTSNMNNSVGIPDIKRFMKAGIPVIIGNDGISFSMAFEYEMLYFAMHHYYQSPTTFTMDDLRKLIDNTYEYASRILGCKLGKIQTGFEADLVVIPYQTPTPITNDNAFGHALFGLFHQFKPRDVFIKGVQVLQDYNVSNALQKQYDKAPQYAEKCWESIRKEAIK